MDEAAYESLKDRNVGWVMDQLAERDRLEAENTRLRSQLERADEHPLADLTADECLLLTGALAGAHPTNLQYLRPDVIRKLFKAEVLAREKAARASRREGDG